MHWRVQRRKPQKHIPSGIILVWLGRDDNKIHTRSIAIQYPLWGKESSWEMTLFHAKAELALRQLNQMRLGDIKYIPTEFEPIITNGLTRQQAKEALLKELQFIPKFVPVIIGNAVYDD